MRRLRFLVLPIHYLLLLLVFAMINACDKFGKEKDSKVIYSHNLNVDTLDFKFTKSHAIIVKGSINNKNYSFLFDTGAEKTMLDSGIIAENLNITRVFEDIAGREFASYLIKIDTLRIANIIYFNQSILSYLRNNIDGIIGGDFMKHFAWKIDFVNKKIGFAENADSFSPKQPGIPFLLRKNIPYLKLMVDSTEVEFMLDMGYTDFAQTSLTKVELSSRFSRYTAWHSLTDSPNFNILDDDKKLYENNLYYGISDLVAENQILTDEMIVFNNRKFNLPGLDFCKKFSYIIIDYPNQKLYLGKRMYKTFDYFENVNYFVNTNGVCISNISTSPYISHVIPSLFNNEISVGDTVVEINNVATTQRRSSFFKDNFRNTSNTARFIPSEYRKLIDQFHFFKDTSVIKIKKGKNIKSDKLVKQFNHINLPDTVHSFQVLFDNFPCIKKDIA